MGGCFGPKQRRQQVYIEVIESIHQQVQHMAFPQTQNIDIYESIKEKLSKKGLLRKLIDNLVSHRNKIYDSLNHNYQIVLQSSRIENKYAGLLIIDQIIEGIYQSLKASNQKLPHNGDNSEDFSNLSNKKTQNLQQSLQHVFTHQSKHNTKLMMAMQGNPLIREIDSRFDLIYFHLIIYLLDNVPKMYLRVLKSINKYSLNKRTKFNCTEQAWEVMNFIMTRILKDISVKQNVFTYMLLLVNTKQNFKQHQKACDLKKLIKLWIQQIQLSISPKTPFQQVVSLEEQSQTIDSHKSQQLTQNLLKIISTYFNNNISTWNSQFLYEILLDIYDEMEFQLEKISHFQSVMFVIVLKNQLHVHFFRGLFILLIEYLCYKPHARGSRVQSSMSLDKEIRWANAEKKQVKFNGLRTLRRWVNNKHVDLNQTVSYNCNLLFQAYLTNFSPLDTHLNTDISKQFLKLVRDNLSTKNKQIVIITIIESIKQEQTDCRIRSLCVSLMRQLLQDGEMFGQLQQNFDFIFNIEEHYSSENKLEIIQLMGFVVKSLSQSYFLEDVEDPNSSQLITFKHKISEFLFSCFDALLYTHDDLLFQYRFCCSVVSFLRQFDLKGNVSIVYAYYLQLLNQLANKNSLKNVPDQHYFLLYLTFQIADLLVKNVNVPNEFALINQKISQMSIHSTKTITPKNQQIHQMIQALTNQEKYTNPNLIKETFKFSQIEFQLKNKINPENYQSISKILSSYFSNSCSKIHKNISTREDNDDFLNHSSTGNFNASKNGNSFGRRDSIFVQSQNGSFYRQEDKNLKDVINIING